MHLGGNRRWVPLVVRELKTMFVRFGIPDILVTDNGPQFSSKEFQVFAKSWSFNHVTTSPRYSQSDGKAENAGGQ